MLERANSTASASISAQWLESFNPEEGLTIRQPERAETGYWVGAPGAFTDPDTGEIYLTYRMRRPRGSDVDRGHVAYLAKSTDGVHFADIWSVDKHQLGTVSMERFAVRRSGSTWLLYLSYVDPADNRWRIDVVTADDPSAFDVARRRPLLDAASTGTEGVKDPYLSTVGPATLMLASYVSTPPLDDEERGRVHGNGDAYTTGRIISPTGLATSLDGITFDWQGEALAVGTGWDRYVSRLCSYLPVPGGYLGFYDGSCGPEENYEERCGLVLAADPRAWTRLTPRHPKLTVPHGSGCFRYVDHARLGGDLLLYYESARPDGSHDLRVSRIPAIGDNGVRRG